jgi:hypothetical protein
MEMISGEIRVNQNIRVAITQMERIGPKKSDIYSLAGHHFFFFRRKHSLLDLGKLTELNGCGGIFALCYIHNSSRISLS